MQEMVTMPDSYRLQVGRLPYSHHSHHSRYNRCHDTIGPTNATTTTIAFIAATTVVTREPLSARPIYCSTASRRSARIQTQTHAKPTQESTDVAPPQPTTQREGERSRIVSSPPRIPRFRQGSPSKTFAASPAGYINPKICKHVDVKAKCLICMDSL
jgi:hypothetical protein